MSLNVAQRQSVKPVSIAYWVVTAVFSLMMLAGAISYLTQPAIAQAFQHLGFPSYFRVELAIAKFIGIVLLLAPVPARVKEWAYAGFGITVVSAIIAHSATDGPATAAMPMVAAVLLLASYTLRLRRELN